MNSKTTLILLLLALSLGARASILRVNHASTASSPDGSTWALAYQDLQDAMDDASSGDQIWVAQGTYVPTKKPSLTSTSGRAKAFHAKNMTLSIYGGFDGTETTLSARDHLAHPTILSGDLGVPGDSTDNAYHVLVFSGMASATVDGLTITEGNADNVSQTNAYFYGGKSIEAHLGGGLYSINSLINIEYCKINNNFAYHGGGALTEESTINIDRSQISDNDAVYVGGGLYVRDNSEVNLDKDTFLNNFLSSTSNIFTTGGGGVSASDYCDVQMQNCLFKGNKSATYGGGIKIRYYSDLEMINCIIDSNSAKSGGGINAYDYCDIDLINCTIKNNHAESSGGGIFAIESNDLYINACQIINNSADSIKGGGIHSFENAQLTLNGSTIKDNTATRGAGINIYRTPASMSYSIIRDNTASLNGGGLQIDSSSVDITNSGFFSNSGLVGGGIRAVRSSTLDIKNTSMTHNTSMGVGGAISVEGSTMSLKKSTIGTNTAGSNGGGLHASNSVLWIDTVDFNDNIGGGYGGAIEGSSGSSLTLMHSMFTDNAATFSGGAVVAQNIIALHDTFTNNHADVHGGGIFTDNLQAEGMIFAENSANDNGGALYVTSSLDLKNTSLHHNTADHGGGIYLSTGTSSSIHTTILSQNTANGYGGGILSNGDLSLRQVTLSDNNAGINGGGVRLTDASADISNCIFGGNTQGGSALSSGSDIKRLGTGSINAKYTLFQTHNGGVGCFKTVYPLFKDASDPIGPDGLWHTADDGLRLKPCSPAINAGHNDSIPSSTTTDIRGVTRILGGTVDMGAYENGGSTAPMALASTDQSSTQTQSNITHYMAGCSNLIATVYSGGADPIAGDVTTTMWKKSTVPTHSGVPFVPRFHAISPASNASTATGFVTLYFTQAEFDAFNAHSASTLNLPTSPTDAAGKSNLRVAKFSGTGSGSTGLPFSYNGAGLDIDPQDNLIVWNSLGQVWQVTFEVTGFSGFFVHTDAMFSNSSLSLADLDFDVIAEDQSAQLRWTTHYEIDPSHFEIERSADGVDYQTLTQVPTQYTEANSDSELSYSYRDDSPLQGTSYYRIRQVQLDGSHKFSEVKMVKFGREGAVHIYPNPATDHITIDFSAATLEEKMDCRLYDMSGRLVRSWQLAPVTGQQSLQMDLSDLVSGMYQLRISDSAGTIYLDKVTKL